MWVSSRHLFPQNSWELFVTVQAGGAEIGHGAQHTWEICTCAHTIRHCKAGSWANHFNTRRNWKSWDYKGLVRKDITFVICKNTAARVTIPGSLLTNLLQSSISQRPITEKPYRAKAWAELWQNQAPSKRQFCIILQSKQEIGFGKLCDCF